MKFSLKVAMLLPLGLICATLGVSLAASQAQNPDYVDYGHFRDLFMDQAGEQHFNISTSMYRRIADKAFTSEVGTQTEPITKLMFNESDFRFSDVFPEQLVSLKSEFYNPLLRTARLHLRANYSEHGIVLGGSWDRPLGNQGGRVGLRVKLPIKRVEVEKVDMEGVRAGAELQDVLSIQPVTDPEDASFDGQAILVRLDFAEGLVQSSHRNSAVEFGNDAGKRTTIGGLDVDHYRWNTPSVNAGTELVNPTRIARNVAKKRTAFYKNYVLITQSPEGFIPRNPDRKLVVRTDIPETDWPVAWTGENVGGSTAFFERDKDYSNLSDEGVSLDQRKKNQELKEELWLIGVQAGTSTTEFPVTTRGEVPAVLEGGTLFNLKALSEQVTENAYEWLHDRGVDFETFTSEGIGDLDGELYYEHPFTDGLIGELAVGLRAPTAEKVLYISDEVSGRHNPYDMPLGNNGHWEAKVSGKMLWEPSRYYRINGDVSWSKVFEQDEERSATFKNSLIKNFGPKVMAKVDWWYFDGGADITFVHPSTKDISIQLGYRFFYKQTENLTFAKKTMPSWLGKKYDRTAGSFSTQNEMLDADLVTERTKISLHRVNWEVAYVWSDWVKTTWGGNWAFLGKNAFRDFDLHFGLAIDF